MRSVAVPLVLLALLAPAMPAGALLEGARSPADDCRDALSSRPLCVRLDVTLPAPDPTGELRSTYYVWAGFVECRDFTVSCAGKDPEVVAVLYQEDNGALGLQRTERVIQNKHFDPDTIVLV